MSKHKTCLLNTITSSDYQRYVPFLIPIGLLCHLGVEHDHFQVRLLSQVLSHGLTSQPPLLKLVLFKVVAAKEKSSGHMKVTVSSSHLIQM